MIMALLTSVGKLGQEVLADVLHIRHHVDKTKLKGYRAQVQEVLSALNSESPKNATRECGINLIHYTIHDDEAYLILCQKSLNENEAFKRLGDLIQFKSSFSQKETETGKKRKKMAKAVISYQEIFDNFYSVPKSRKAKVKTHEFISSDEDSDSDDPSIKLRLTTAENISSVEKPIFLCSECGFSTAYKFNLDRHCKLKNCDERKGTLKCPENDCEWYSVSLKDLDTHMSTNHGREFEREEQRKSIYFNLQPKWS